MKKSHFIQKSYKCNDCDFSTELWWDLHVMNNTILISKILAIYIKDLINKKFYFNINLYLLRAVRAIAPSKFD